MVPGDATRPILDRVKENLFNILGPWVRGSTWVDLFAGTGQVGIEALSRGAASVLFTDMDRKAIATIKENLAITKLGDRAEVRREDAFSLLARPPAEGDGVEVMFIAPPQYRGMWVKALQAVDAHPTWLVADGIAIVQIDPNEYDTVPELTTLELYDERTYGRTMLLFYERPVE
jgi:16S rRNA (guanine(966)-N(2))-methyltransferase RsmD